MKDIFIVIKFTLKEMLKRKSFIISTIIILLFIFIGFNIPRLADSISGEEAKTRMELVDVDNIYGESLNSITEYGLSSYEFTIANDSIETVKDKITNDEIDEAIIISNNNGTIDLDYIVYDDLYTLSIPEEITAVLTNMYQTNSISNLNLTQEEVSSLYPTFNTVIEDVNEEEPTGNIYTMMMLSIILFYAIYFCAFQVSSSITTEKTSKIIETLATSTSPTNIVIGKTLGIGFAGLCQLVLIIADALLSGYFCMDKDLISSILDPSTLTVGLFIITLLYFILGYLAYAFLYALTGSTVSKPEDIQSANGPIAIIAVAGFYLSYFSLSNPTSGFNSLAAMLPISSPFCMPLRYMMGLASITDVLISLFILIVTIILIALIAIKVYKNAILNYGSKFSIKDIIKLFKQN